MKARDVISHRSVKMTELPCETVEADMSVVDVLPVLLESPSRAVGVRSGESGIGVIDEGSLLDGFGRMLMPRGVSSLVTVETSAAAYSAERMARAVEDADTHLVDMWSVPSSDGGIMVTLRVQADDPSSAVSSLERYGYRVVEASGRSYRDADLAAERMAALQALLDV